MKFMFAFVAYLSYYRAMVPAKYFFRIIVAVQGLTIFPSGFRRGLLSAIGVKIARSTRIAPHVHFGSKQVSVGERSFINIGCFLDGSAALTIGDDVRIAPYVKIVTGSHEISNSVIRRDPNSGTIGMPVEIHRGCWIGTAAVILPGVKISEGCVIGAGSVVIHDTEPNGLYVGCPAMRARDLPIQ